MLDFYASVVDFERCIVGKSWELLGGDGADCGNCSLCNRETPLYLYNVDHDSIDDSTTSPPPDSFEKDDGGIGSWKKQKKHRTFFSCNI